MTLHGYVRLTEVVDILVERSTENISRLLKTLSGYGDGYARELTVDDFADEEGAIRVVEEAEMSQIEIFTRLSGMHFEDLIKGAEHLELSGRLIHFASKAALIRLKERSDREKDQYDVVALKKLEQDPRAFD